MPRALANGLGNARVKTEAGSPDQISNVAHGPTVTQTARGSSENIYEESSVGGDTVPTRMNDLRKGRSDAPPPSERPTESDLPMLRELRIPARENGNGLASPPAEESLNFQTSFRELGKKLKAHNDTLGELQGLGVSHDVPLPELVLVGDQSAGKSSVMSGLANLDLPRSEGTCTRCPLHIRVSRNADWSCRVSLQKMYKYDPPNEEIDEKDVTDEDPFFPWRKLSNSSTTEFKTVHENAEIEQVLRWAQVALLNPDKPSELFVPGSGALARENEVVTSTAKFSPNVVFLEIKGPDMPNLSFYDLPGIFQNSKEARDSYTIHVVKNLSRSYIRRKSAIIMCSMPMNSDAENSCTFSEVRRLGALNRTVGVLTKADLLQPDHTGSGHKQWLEIMEGRAHQTGLGYFITSRPQHLKDLDQLTQWEHNMFNSKTIENWPQAFHKFESRCGVEPLKELLSHKLGEQFAQSLPEIEKKVTDQLARITRALKSLPDLPDNTEHEVKRSLRLFSETARQKIETFRCEFNTLPRAFQQCVIGIHPKFIVKDASDQVTIDVSSDDEDTPNNTPTRPQKRKNGMAPPETPSKRQRQGSTVPTSHVSRAVSPKPEGSDAATPPPPPPKSKYAPPFDKFDNIGRGFRTIAQVRREVEEKARAGMPSNITPAVYESLALEGLKPIELPMNTFLDETRRLINTELGRALRESFDDLKNRFIYQECRKHLGSFLHEHVQEAKALMDRVYRSELKQIATFNYETFERNKEAELIVLTRYRHKQRMISYHDPKALADKDKPLRDWATMSEAERDVDTKKRAADIQKIGPDRFAKELEVISYVRGYYRLAAERFSDYIINIVLCEMIPAMKDRLSIFLDEKLGLIGSGADKATYDHLMEEDPETSTKRETLRREMAKFDKALNSINALKQGDDDVEDTQSLMDDATVGEM